MKRVVLIAAACALAACGLHSKTPTAPSLADLRRAADAKPNDANAWQSLALAEIFSSGGDVKRMAPELEHARKLAPKAPRLLFADALLHDVHGQPSDALELYLQAIEQAAVSDDPLAPHVIEAAAYATAGSDGSAPGYAERVSKRLAPLLAKPELGSAARSALADLLMPLAYRRGDHAEIDNVAHTLGCVTEFRVAGPFGPRELLGFDEPPPSDLGAPLAASYDLGGSRGTRPTRTLHTRGCTLHLGGSTVADAGTTFAQSSVQIAKAGSYVLRLDTPNSIELYVDGKSVTRIDRRSRLSARLAFRVLELSAGTHVIALKVGTRHPNPVLELALLPLMAADEAGLGVPYTDAAGLPQAYDGFELYMHVGISLLRGDVLNAREALSQLQAKTAAPLLLLQRASVALGDPLLPDDVRSDDGRRYLAAAHARDAELWAPVAQLASIAAKNGRVKEATSELQKASAHWSKSPPIGLALVELLRSKGLGAQADREIARLRELVPDACQPISAELESLRSRQRQTEAEAVATKLVACDAQSAALYTTYVNKRDYASAAREQARLASYDAEDSHYTWLLSSLALAKNSGDDAALAAKIAELRRDYPRSYSGAIEEIDRLGAQGDEAGALTATSRALEAEPTSMAELYRLQPVLGGKHVLAEYRKDGEAIIKAFEASGKTYDAPQVLVFDYMASRVFEDGSSLELVHTIQKAQSDEAVNQLGEVEIPEGAEVLTLRAWKPDGRKLEADVIAGKQSISLPNVASGDYIELEYLQANSPADGFPHGYLGERFYFESFEVPFHHSQMVMILPKSMPYGVDPRGPAPAISETVSGDLRVLNWQVDQSLPLVAEPASVSAREFIPSIRIGVNATWTALVESLRDVLIDRDLYDPYYAGVVRQIVGEASPTDYRLRAERLYSWVLEHVDNNNDVFSQAALMLRAKAGNRARVLHYLLGLAGVPSHLALARNFAGDRTESAMADADTYDHLLVRVDVPQLAPTASKTGAVVAKPSVQALWLFTAERWAPFGYMPPILRGQPALMLEPGAASTQISQGLLGEDVHKFSMDVKVQASGAARIDIVELVHGTDAVSWRSQLEQIPVAELTRKFEQDYVARLFPSATLASLEITGREQAAPDLTLTYSIDVSSFGRQVAGGIALPPLLASELASNFARTSSRKTAELMSSPVRSVLEARISLPSGAKPVAVSQPSTLTAAFAARPTFVDQSTWQPKQSLLTVQRTLVLPAMRVETQDYPAFAEFCRQVDQLEGRELVIALH